MEKLHLVLEVPGKQVFVISGDRVVKPNITRVLPAIVDDNEQEILSLLKSLSTISTGGPLAVIAAKYITENDPIQWSKGFQKVRKAERR